MVQRRVWVVTGDFSDNPMEMCSGGVG